jgi:hypothetical protein
MLWALAFAGVLSLNRSFIMEKKKGGRINGVPGQPGGHYAGRC